MSYENKRIFIVVKTYPTISKKYSELVCTAGILEDGSWIRLYPITFRKLDIEQKYPKYTWISVRVEKNNGDFRPETYRPDIDSIIIEEKPKKADWNKRREIIFKKEKPYKDLQELIKKAKSTKLSLATFQPTKILNFVIEETDREWNSDKLNSLRKESEQYRLFQTPEEIEQELKTFPKIPYKFSYEFTDINGKKSKLMIEDWEIGALYFKCYTKYKDEKTATEKVKEKYFDEFKSKDIHFFLGTTKQHHMISRNPFIIIGVFYPPKSEPTLFDNFCL